VPAKHSTVYRTSYVTKGVTRYVNKRVKTYVSSKKTGKRVARYVTKRVPTKVRRRVPVRTAVRVAFDESKYGILSCQRNLITQARGALEAADAIAKTEAEGFPRGTIVFLDIERMDVTPKAMREYYKEWVAGVLADGRFTPGIYAHVHNAPLIYRDVKSVYTAAGRTDEPAFWIAGGRNFSPTKLPQDVGHAFAAVWQGILDVVQEWNGHKEDRRQRRPNAVAVAVWVGGGLNRSRNEESGMRRGSPRAPSSFVVPDRFYGSVLPLRRPPVRTTVAAAP
jgi:hypothetical protein